MDGVIAKAFEDARKSAERETPNAREAVLFVIGIFEKALAEKALSPTVEMLMEADPEADYFKETWAMWRHPVDFDAYNTDHVRMGWPKPTIYREHDAIHVLANIIDRQQLLLDTYRQEATP